MISYKNEEKGITLIALVVTVLVILVLAGISISMLSGENGILKRATEAKEKTENAQNEETDKFIMIEAVGQDAGKAITNPLSYGKNCNAQATADGDGKYFALPESATYIMGTVDTGVVVNIKGSEFVWVPVDDVVLDTSKESNLPKNSSNGTLNENVYTPMAVKVGSDYKGVLYDFFENNSYLRFGNDEFYQGLQYREPDVSFDYDGGSFDTVDGKITLSKLTSEYNAMIESVLKYKGFYVARYEAGLDENNNIVFKNASVEENNVTTADASNSETNTWYGLYKKLKTFTTDSDKVVSSMIWGSQYDAMMNWMAKSGNWIGSSNSSIYNNTDITGNKSTDVINNVYDLYGCHREWTMETYGNNFRTARGGFKESVSSPASIYGSYLNDINIHYSSRATLYIR